MHVVKQLPLFEKKLLMKIQTKTLYKNYLHDIAPRYEERQGGYTRILKWVLAVVMVHQWQLLNLLINILYNR